VSPAHHSSANAFALTVRIFEQLQKRRRWLFLLPPLLAIWALLIEPGRLVRRHVQRTWTQAPVRIVFFSDLHQGSPHIDTSYVASLVARVNAENADAVLIGGDLLINGVAFGEHVPIATVSAGLAKLHSRLGTFAVLGNHDWWNDGDQVRATLTQAGVRVLENESIALGHGSARFNLVGIGDDLTQHAQLARAFSSVDAALPTIVFMHDASIFLEDPDVHFELALGGHTHGGQVYLPILGALVRAGRAPLAWAYGRTQLPQGTLHVSGGIGTSIFPIRFNMPPEYLVIDFVHE
jgi:uncharacterized protein